MKYVSILFNIIFFFVGGCFFLKSKQIPKPLRYGFGLFFVSVSVIYFLYTVFCFITGRNMILLY